MADNKKKTFKHKHIVELECKNSGCHFNSSSTGSDGFPPYCCMKDGTIHISVGGCKDFTPNILYYIVAFTTCMGQANFIMGTDLANKDVAIGAYYVIDIYDLQLVENKNGTFTWYAFVKEGYKDGKNLNANDIIALPYDVDKYMKWEKLLIEQNITPDLEHNIKKQMEEKKEKEEREYETFLGTLTEEQKKQYSQYGFLSPIGKIYPGATGDHSLVAYEIIKMNPEMSKRWKEAVKNDQYENRIDFLIKEYNYALIHNPSGCYIEVTCQSLPLLTVQQIKFVVDYFLFRKDYQRANDFIEYL